MKNKLKYIMVASLLFGASGFNSVMAEVLNLTANMDCAQADAGAGTCGLGGSGAGVGTMTFDTVTNLFSWNVSHSGLSGAVTAAHFHGPAQPNQNAGVQVGIGTLNPAISSMVIAPAQAAELLAGQWYINIHSASFPAGEIRGQVDVVSTPTCDIQLDQTAYIDGDTVIADVFRIANPTAALLAVEWKVWLTVPGVPPISIINLGADGSFALPAGADTDLGPLPLLPVDASLPRGNYEFSCRLLDPVTGELLAEDLNFFEIRSMAAGFNYLLYDDFSDPSGNIDFTIWNPQGGATAASTIDIVGNALVATAVKDGSVRANQGLWVANSTNVALSNFQAFKADFTILETTGNTVNRAQILLGFPLDANHWVDTGINFYPSGDVNYFIEIFNDVGQPITEIVSGTITTVDPALAHTLAIGWDGSNYIFQVDNVAPIIVPMTSETDISTATSWGWAAVRATAKDAGTGTSVVKIDNVHLGGL